MNKTSRARAAGRMARRLDELGRVTDTPGSLTRTFLSPAMARANALVGQWMAGAGMSVREDAVGNVIGRLEGTRRGQPTLVIGSHLDTVRNAGRFDGAAGVLMGIAAVEALRGDGVRLPFALEVVGFSEEEGVRFSSGYIGSKGYAGLLSAADLALCDVSGATLREVLGRRAGRRFAPPRAAHARGGLLGYLEVHIEQGPVLEAGKLPLGVVTGIAGQTRGRITLVGRAGHAGTTPMALRRDALAGAAELILFAEALARRGPPLVATVGSLSVAPGAPNVIPGEVVLSLDVRHPRDPARRAGLRRLLARARRIARRRGLRCSWHATQDNGAVACSRRLTSLLEKGVRSVQGRSLRLASGAGHDAVVMASAAPVAMLFVRCRGGVSHHPSEHAARADLGAALAATLEFLDRLAGGGGRP